MADETQATEAVRAAARAARAAAPSLASAPDGAIGAALGAMAAALADAAPAVLAANADDMRAALDNGLPAGVRDRLRLDEDRLKAMAAQLEILAGVEPEPASREIRDLPGGLVLAERRRPVGVIGANFEARPNVVVDIASQLVKSRNAGVLRTGSAALRSAIALADEVIAPSLASGGPRPGRDPADPGARPGRRLRAGPRAEAGPAGDPARQRRLDPGAGGRGGGARGAHARARRRRRGALHSLLCRTGGGLVADRAAAWTGLACATGSTCCSSTTSCGTRGCRRSPGSWPGSASRPRSRRTTTRSATSGRSTPSARPR